MVLMDDLVVPVAVPAPVAVEGVVVLDKAAVEGVVVLDQAAVSVMPTGEIAESDGKYTGFFTSFEDLVPSRAVEHLGDSDLTFDNRLSRSLKIHEDGGESGCGGKIWIAGELLAKYVLDFGLVGKKKVIEIGSGTGLVGLSLGLSDKKDDDVEIYITDIDELVPLMNRNIELNGLGKTVKAETLSWGEELPEYAKEGVDVVLAADCVYLESAFPLLEKTLVDLTNKDTLVLMSYRKRRKADVRFFKKIRKHFDIVPVTNFPEYAVYLKQQVHLFQLQRK